MGVVSTPRRHDSFRLPPGAIALALALKYAGLVGYGVHATVVNVPSFVTVGGEAFATVWAIMVTTLAGVALAGVVRTWVTERPTFEKWSTFALIVTFLAYSVVLVIRGMSTNDWDAIPLAWLPALLTAFPLVRYYCLVWRAA